MVWGLKLLKQRNTAKNLGYSRPSVIHPSSSLTNYRTCDKREPVNSPGSSSCEVSGALMVSFFIQTVEWQQAWFLSYLYGSLRRRGITLDTSFPPARFLVTPVQANIQTNGQLIYQWPLQLSGNVVIDELCHKTKKIVKIKSTLYHWEIMDPQCCFLLCSASFLLSVFSLYYSLISTVLSVHCSFINRAFQRSAENVVREMRGRDGWGMT